MRKGLLLCLGTLLLHPTFSPAQQNAPDPGPTPDATQNLPTRTVVIPGEPVPPGGDSAPAAARALDAERVLRVDADQPRLWFSAEYLMWWTRKSPVPVPLVTTTSDNPQNNTSGNANSPTSTILLGDQGLRTHVRSGGRFSAGWLNGDGSLGVESSYLFLARSSVAKSVGSPGLPGSPTLFIPFFDISGTGTPTGMPGETVGSAPLFPLIGGGLGGTETLRLTTSLQGADLDFSARLAGGPAFSLDLLGGFRWLQLHEDLNFSTRIRGVTGTPFEGSIYNSADDFNVRNNFYGGQVGLRTRFETGALSVSATGKVGLGDMHQTAVVNGVTVTNDISAFASGTFVGATTQTIAGGAFAQPSNIGHHSQDRFAVVPEVNVTVGYQVTDWARASVGYSFLYLSDVARPGDLINRNINFTRTGVMAAAQAAGIATGLGFPAAPVGPPGPTFTFHDSSYWAQGLNFGLEFRY